jgi:uncharacterized protein YegP (UPF0339 family)
MPRYTVEIYRDVSRTWRWRLRARNKKLIACAGEGYRRKADCVRMVRRLFPMIETG